MLTGRHLSRRTALKGLGVTIALPFLDAMVPAGAVGRDNSNRVYPESGFGGAFHPTSHHSEQRRRARSERLTRSFVIQVRFGNLASCG